MTTARRAGPAPPALRFGARLRSLRDARGLKQAQLTARANVSARHLSFLETGRAVPSRDMVLALADALELPLRARNDLLVAAGFAPIFTASPFQGLALAPVRRAIDHLLRVHEPFAAMVIDRDWNILQWNEGARRLWQWALDGRVAPPEVLTNAIRAATDPRALRPSIVNWDAIATTMAQHLQAECDAENDAERRARLARLRTDVGDVPRSLHASALPFVPLALRAHAEELRLFITVTTLGTPTDVTAQELRIESYFPADPESERLLRRLAEAPGG